LEVAESLITSVNLGQQATIDKELCAKLQLPAAAASDGEDSEDVNKCWNMWLSRAANIREDILGSTSPQVADVLASLGEDGQLRAISIYEKRFGAQSNQVTSTYALLAGETQDPLKVEEYKKRANIGSALRQAGNDPFKKAYVYLKGTLPEKQRQDRQDLLTKAFKSLGSNPPEIKDPVRGYDGIGWQLDAKKLSVPELDHLMANSETSYDSELFRDQLFLDGGLKGKTGLTEFRMDLPTWGQPWGDDKKEHDQVTVIGKGRIRFRQEGAYGKGFQQIECQQVDYKWNGKTFEEVAGKPGDHDAEIVRSAIDDAVNGLASYGLRGHHAVNHDLIENALSRANAAAQELSKKGDAYGAADRLRIMFELTSDLVQEASTGVPVESTVDDSKDDVQKWIGAWTYKGSPSGSPGSSPCSVNLTAKEWGPYLHNYAFFRQRAGDTARARKVLEAVKHLSEWT